MTNSERRLAACGILAAILSSLSGCSSEQPAPSPAAVETVSGVAVVTAQKTTAPDWLEAVGTVRAAQTSQVAAQIMGNIVSIQAREGDRVQPGQTLAVLDDAQAQQALQQAAAGAMAAQQEVSAADSEFALAQATRRRYQQLFDRKSVSPQEYDEVQARLQSAEARLEMARAGQARTEAAVRQAQTALGYTKIQAPFAGLVTEKQADAGSLASPGMALFTLEDTRGYRLEATVDESDAGVVRLGQAVTVMIDALGGRELSGKVAQMVPAADAASRSFLVRVDLPANSGLRSGLFGRARLVRGERPRLLVPQAAMVTRGQLQGIYVVDADGIAGIRYVTLGRLSGQDVEILSGLQEGEKLVAAPAGRELSGKRIAP